MSHSEAEMGRAGPWAEKSQSRGCSYSALYLQKSLECYVEIFVPSSELWSCSCLWLQWHKGAGNQVDSFPTKRFPWWTGGTYWWSSCRWKLSWHFSYVILAGIHRLLQWGKWSANWNYYSTAIWNHTALQFSVALPGHQLKSINIARVLNARWPSLQNENLGLFCGSVFHDCEILMCSVFWLLSLICFAQVTKAPFKSRSLYCFRWRVLFLEAVVAS